MAGAMPPDVFLALASSGITLVASLLFFVSEDRPPREVEIDPENQVTFCLPPHGSRVAPLPPPLPAADCELTVASPAFAGALTLRHVRGEEWTVSFERTPLADSPAVRIADGEPGGPVHDLRFHGQAGVVKATKVSWKQKPGRA